MKILKVKSILFSLLAMMAVTVLMTSCEQTELTNQEDIIQYPTPVQYIVDDNPVDFSNYQTLVLSEIVGNGTIVNRGFCPAHDHAFEQLLMAFNNCEYSFEYCEYLRLFWKIHLHIAAINCETGTSCDNCDWKIRDAYWRLNDLRDTGIHDSYIQNILQQIQMLENVCASCGN